MEQGNRKTDQEKWHDLWETEKQNEARAAFSSMFNQCFADQKGLTFFSASLSASLIFFSFTLPTTGQNRIILKCSNLEANQCAAQPRGAEHCVEGRCNNSDVLETYLEVLSNIRVHCKYPHSFCPPLSLQADASASSTSCPRKEMASQKRHEKEKVNSWLGSFRFETHSSV